MHDAKKTKAQLIEELEALRRRMAEMEKFETERKKMEQVSSESAQKYRTLFENANDAIFLADVETGVLWDANREAERLTGRPRSEIIGMHQSQLHPADELEYYKEKFRKHTELGRTADFEAEVVKKDGTTVPVYISANVMRLRGKMVIQGIFRDITERKRLENEVLEAKEYYENLVGSAGDAIISEGADQRVITWSMGAQRLYGYSQSEALGRSPKDLIGGPDKGREITDFTNEVLTGGNTPAYEAERYRKNGDKVAVAIALTPLRDRDGNIAGAVGIHKDITERKRLEREVVETKEFLESLIATAGDAIICASRDSYIVTVWNPAAERLYGHTAEEALGKSLFSLIVPVERKEEAKKLGRRLQQRQETQDYETQRRRKDGSLVWVSISLAPLLDKDSGYIGGIAIHKDITELKRTETRRVSEYFQNLVGSAGDAIVAVDCMGNITVWNIGAERIFGYPQGEALGRPVHSLLGGVDQSDKMKKIRQRVLDGESLEPFEAIRYRQDGTAVWLSVTSSPLRDSDGKIIGISSIYKDITEQKKAEEKLLTHQEQLRSLASKLSLSEEHERHRIAADLHDRIGQTLVMSKMKLAALRESVPAAADGGDMGEVLELLDQSIRDTRHLTFDLSPPILYDLGLEAALEWLVEQHREDHGILCEFEDDGLPKPLDEDVRVHLFRAVQELLVNVAKHARAHSAKVATKRDDGSVRVEVKDDGVGFEASEVWSPGQGSGGFGLFSVRERLDHLGGRFEIESEPGKGTRVTLVAPLKPE